MSEAMSKIDSITMYGEGNTAKLTEEISKMVPKYLMVFKKLLALILKAFLQAILVES